jgi:tetratricopeptide (TPR) repeat protein
MGHRHRILVLALVAAVGLIWCGWTWRESRIRRAAIAAIEAEIAANRHAIAARSLTQLIAQGPDDDEANYLLGVCEQARGRDEPAAVAWARVTPGSSFFARAILARMSLLTATGQLAAAEQLIVDAAKDPRCNPTALRILLVPNFSEQGRDEESQRLVEKRWEYYNEIGEGASEQAINLVRLYVDLRSKPMPIDVVRASLDKAAKRAPDDDRVWLGRANLAIRTEHSEEAQRWLDACVERRPDDVPVWRARLNWAMATSRGDVVRQALTRLPASECDNAQVSRIQAWLAAKQGDQLTEVRSLERAVAAEPADLAGLERLAELAHQRGEPARAVELRRHAAEIDRLIIRYQKLHERNQPIRDSTVMGQLAEKLGRPFEAKAYLTVAAAQSLNRDGARRDLERVSRLSAQPTNKGRSIAETLAADHGISTSRPEEN